MADEPLNPYAPPQSTDRFAPDSLQPNRKSTGYARPYQSARGKATLAIWATVISLILQVLMLGSCYMQLSLLQGANNGTGIDPVAANANDGRQRALGVGVVIAALASLITLLMWIYAANANLHALGCTNIDFTPGWSVGWFFVPFLNLFKPYQVVSEIWQGSDPASLLKAVPSGTALIGWWWGLRICSGIVGRLSNSFGSGADTIDELIGITWLAIALIVVIDAPLLILQTMLISRVQGFQDERYSLLMSQPPPALPDSPTDPLANFR